MDSISTKILNAKKVREEIEARRLQKEREREEKLRTNPEYLRRIRFCEAREALYATLSARCLKIQAETQGVEEQDALHFEPVVLTGKTKYELLDHALLPSDEWIVRINETTLSIELDPSGSDTEIDFFGSITLLGRATGRKMFFVSPDGKFWVVSDTSTAPAACPSDYFSLRALLKSGALAEKSSFAALLEEGLEGLVTMAVEESYDIPKGWMAVEVVPPIIRQASPADLGVSPKEIQRLSPVSPTA
jgi:hypothetical protein